MNYPLKSLLDDHLPVGGVVAWSALSADRSVSSQCYETWIMKEHVEQAVMRLVSAGKGFREQGIKPLRMNWAFDQVRVHLAIRSDGGCLALFVENGYPALLPKINALLEQYEKLLDA